MPTFFQFKTYFAYWLDQVSEHSLHSPFLFDFYTKVLHAKSDPAIYHSIEQRRKEYLHDTTLLTIQDPGAGSLNLKTSSRKVCDIARTSLSSSKYSSLYARIIHHFNCKSILELGTSLGINTLYLATKPDSSVTTLEGAPPIATIALDTFKELNKKNIRLVEGNINSTLYSYLGNCTSLDFAFLDANHRYEPTLKYFDAVVQKIHVKSIVVLDDIHYSPEMEKAWNHVRKHALVYASVDLYRCGLLFFDPSLNKQHVVLQF
ncbi:O-methyltransferase [Ohtaekwangia kribbensis]|jgi:predicted O-methyltransferase YrrM|uniref:O-methyltransferase n=1 Tax=Ohtaekwangia kribbensis TaxID=688913 RepID=A0ABW3JX41_9BACT